jgi:hypothetical protein
MQADYLDIADDGTIIRGNGVESGGDAFVQFGHDVPIGVPVYVRNLVVRRDAGACAYKGQDGRCYLVSRTGAVSVRGDVYGDEAVAFTPDGRLVFVASQTHYNFGGVTMPLPPHRVGTSQGIIDVRDDGSILWTDDQFSTPRDLRTFGGVEFVKYRTIGPWTFGLSQVGCARFNAVTLQLSVAPQANRTSWTLRGAVVNDVLMVVSSQPGLVLGPDDWTPYVPAPAPVPVPVPPVVPVPEVPIVSTMMLPADVHATFAAVAEKFPHTGDDNSRREAVRRAVETLRARHGPGWVCKSEHGGDWRTASKDAIGYVPFGTMHGVQAQMFIWDMVNGTTRKVEAPHLSEPKRPAYALVPDAADWLATSTPQPPPVVVPPPVVAPPVTPPAQPAPDLTAVLEKLDALMDEMAQHRLDMAGMEVALRNEILALTPPGYKGTAKGGWPLGTVSITLTPEATKP